MRCPLSCVSLLAALLVAFAPSVYAQYPIPADSISGPVLEPETDEEANQATDPNRIPYQTKTSVGAHVLALPATLWSGVARVFREGVLWAEYSGTIERLQRRYGGPEPPAYGFIPIVSVGGSEGLVVGGAFFYNNVFGTGRRTRISARYGGSDTYSVSGRFRDQGLFGSRIKFGLDGGYYSDGDERFFERGNDTEESDRIEYSFRQGLAEATFLVPVYGPFRLDLSTEFKHIDILDDSDTDDAPLSVDVIGFGAADMLSAGGDIIFDFSRSAGLTAPRKYGGSILLLGYRYGQDLGSRNFAYHRTKAEWRQFVPVPFLAFDRRLAFRARLEKTHPPKGNLVPFYELATLGGPNSLRGFAANRFRDEGYLLFTAEYRYPVWDILDAVVFFDTGQVFQRYEDIDPAVFHSNVGAGLRVFSASDVAGRLEIAFGPEGPRLLAQIGTTF